MTATPPAHARSTKQVWAGGLTTFAAVMLMIAGVLSVFRGIMAIAQDDVFVTTPNYVFKFDLTGWGWIHLILGAVAVIVGLGLFQVSTWSRVAGVTIAGLGRLQLPAEYTRALGMRDRVALELEPDHIGVWP
ncbi:hypothetical protein, partial [Streptomyces sp. NPDC005209]|uniref:DUF7144 family membrane protein n=1 Tax=Streptomyces sp. NPDC005209 TaxID=3156715 RepID=UPI00339EE6B5